MKILCLGDIHFGLKVNDPIFYEINLNLFDWIAQTCKEKDIKDVWIAGDIFHNRKEINILTLNNACSCFEKIKDLNVRMIVGNHDAWFLESSEKHSLDMFKNWDNIKVYDQITYETINGKSVGFYPWVGKQYNENIPKLDVVLGHFEIIGFDYDNCTATHGTPPSVFSDVKLTITGHFHGFQDRKLKKSRIYYVGSPYEHNWGDLGKKYVHILDLNTLELQKVENKISPKHIFIKDINDIDSNIKGQFVKIQLETPEQETEYSKKLEDFTPLHITIERIVDVNGSNVQISNLKNVELLPAIEEFINGLSEEPEILKILLNENKKICKDKT